MAYSHATSTGPMKTMQEPRETYNSAQPARIPWKTWRPWPNNNGKKSLHYKRSKLELKIVKQFDLILTEPAHTNEVQNY